MIRAKVPLVFCPEIANTALPILTPREGTLGVRMRRHDSYKTGFVRPYLGKHQLCVQNFSVKELKCCINISFMTLRSGWGREREKPALGSLLETTEAQTERYGI